MGALRHLSIMPERCHWAANGGPSYVEYHDREWGVPQHDDRVLFEFLILEGAQAGLSWSTILNKRENYRKGRAFRPRQGDETAHGPGHRPQSPESGIHGHECTRLP
jgi:hypothetical protein